MDAIVVGTTVTLVVSETPPADTRMTTFPARIPETDPSLTVATDGSLLDHAAAGRHMIIPSPVASYMVT